MQGWSTALDAQTRIKCLLAGHSASAPCPSAHTPGGSRKASGPWVPSRTWEVSPRLLLGAWVNSYCSEHLVNKPNDKQQQKQKKTNLSVLPYVSLSPLSLSHCHSSIYVNKHIDFDLKEKNNCFTGHLLLGPWKVKLSRVFRSVVHTLTGLLPSLHHPGPASPYIYEISHQRSITEFYF